MSVLEFWVLKYCSAGDQILRLLFDDCMRNSLDSGRHLFCCQFLELRN